MPRKADAQARSRLAAGANASDGSGESLEHEQGFAASDSEEQAARPVVKKQSRRSSVRTTRKGKLSGLLRLPAELITTICQHLDLETLFHVSRLNKYLWRLLRQTTSLEYLWERARIESGLPELTAAGMNVFEYANLVFGCCQGCGVSTAKVDYLLRVRYCSPCAKTAQILPMNANGQEAAQYKYLISDIEHIRSHVRGMAIDLFGQTQFSTTERHKNHCQHVVCASLGDEYTSSEFRDAWALHRVQRTGDGIGLIKWQIARREEREEKLEQLRQRRREAIEAKFVELGWHPHHFEADWWVEHSLVTVARELTENVWRSVKAPLMAELELHREAADAWFLASVYFNRRVSIQKEFDALSSDEACQLGLAPKPRWVDFERFPTIRAILEPSDVQQAYNEPDPTIRDKINDIVEDWRASVGELRTLLRDRLLEVIRVLQQPDSALGSLFRFDVNDSAQQLSPDASIDRVLNLAVGVFECRSPCCARVDTFPRILSHVCFPGHNIPLEDAYVPSEKAVLIVLKLLKVNSMPCDATAAELDELDHTWTCLDHPGALIASTWREVETLEAAKDRLLA
ncbi:hypothetical protein JCM8115_005856 [Rhodotorula mucilaginosa]